MVPPNHRINETKDAVRKTVDQVLRIQQSGIAMLPLAGVETRVKAIAAMCMELVSIDDIRIHLVGPDADHLGVSIGEDSALVNGIISSDSQTIEEPGTDPLWQAVLSGRASYIKRGAKDAMVGSAFWDMNDRMHAIYFIPLLSQARIIGVLRAGTRNSEGIRDETMMGLDLLAPPFALAIENAWLHQQLRTPVVDDQRKQARGMPEDPSVSSRDRVAWMAHEIKTPLTTISTFIQLFPSKWTDDHFRTSFYPIARDETQRLSRLVNDMLDRGKNQSTRLMAVDIQELVCNLVAGVVPLAERRHVRFETHFALASSSIRIDKGRIKEAIINLFDNAMEATPDAGKISIRLEDFVMPGGRPAIQLEIQDSGPGIDKGRQAEIFDPYMSTKVDGHLPGGTGLGLYIARHNVQAHGGTIEVESLAGRGSTFSVRLPQHPPPA